MPTLYVKRLCDAQSLTRTRIHLALWIQIRIRIEIILPETLLLAVF